MNLVQSNGSPVEQDLKRIGKNTLLYSVGNVAVKIISFLLIPLYTNYFPAYEVGIIVLFELMEVFYASVAPLGVPSALWRFFYRARKEGDEKRYVSSNYFFLLAANLILVLLLVFSGRIVAKYLLSAENYTSLVQVLCIALFFGIGRIFILALLRIYEKALHFIILVFFEVIILLSLTIWFVVGLDLGLWGVIYAKLISGSIIFVYSFIFILKKFGIRYHHPHVVETLRYGIPLILHSMGLLILTMSDRYFIKEIISVSTGGVYGIAYKFGMIMNMILVTPFVQAFHPILFRLENDRDQKMTYQRAATHFVQMGTIGWLLISVMSKYLIIWTTTEEFYSGIIIVPWVAFAYLLYGMQSIFKAGALLNNATLKISKFVMIAALVNIILNLLMIPRFEMIGAAIATVLSYILMLILVLQLSQKYLYVNWRWDKMLSILGLGVGVYLLSLIKLPNIKIEFVRDLFIVIAFPLLLIMTKLISFQELIRFLRSFKSKKTG